MTVVASSHVRDTNESDSRVCQVSDRKALKLEAVTLSGRCEPKHEQRAAASAPRVTSDSHRNPLTAQVGPTHSRAGGYRRGVGTRRMLIAASKRGLLRVQLGGWRRLRAQPLGAGLGGRG